MALCKVIRSIDGWNVGDEIESSGERLQELIDLGIVEVLIPDPKPLELHKEKETDASQNKTVRKYR